MIERLILGVDCATDPRKVGLAIGHWQPGRLRLLAARLGTSDDENLELLAAWLGLAPAMPAVVALDAPLGWPAELGRRLAGHRAGEALPVEANQIFRRETDRFVHREMGKRPLDVGADRIARTAHAALDLLAGLRRATGCAIPMALQPGPPDATVAIEVYPAATLHARGLRSSRYKRRDQRAERRTILEGLASDWRLESSEAIETLQAHADALDAAICVLAGADFLAGRALAPEDPGLAGTEGWIWVAPPAARPADPSRNAPSSDEASEAAPAQPPLLVVDGANVVGSVPDGWWRDRPGAARRLRDALVDVAASGLGPLAPEPIRHGPVEVVLVVEGAARGLASIDDVDVVTAAGSGDDAIVEIVAARSTGRRCVVATADRELIERVRALGGVTIGPRSVPRR